MPHATTRSLDGTVVAITGASAGIGTASARALVAAGARVALSARRADRLGSLVSELGEDNAVAVAGDVRDPAHNEDLVAAAVQRWGRLDTMVANAGIGAYGGILDLDDAQLQEMVETNYLGTVWSVRSAVRQFRAQGDGGDLVVVSSVAGFRGGADEAVYAGTEARTGRAGRVARPGVARRGDPGLVDLPGRHRDRVRHRGGAGGGLPGARRVPPRGGRRARRPGRARAAALRAHDRVAAVEHAAAELSRHVGRVPWRA